MMMVALFCGTSLSAQWNPRHPGWTDSYKANGFCWCDTTFDHNLASKKVTINGTAYGVREICNELKKHPQYRAYRNGDAPYNDIQCGNGPANDAPDEAGCPGRTDLGSSGCQQKGPRWDMNWLKTRVRFGGNNGGNNGGGNNIGVVTFKGQSNNKFISSENGGRSMTGNRNSAGAMEKFTVQSAGNGMVSIKGSNGKYVSHENGTKAMKCDRNGAGAWEKFTLVSQGGNVYAIKGSNGKYVSHENGGANGITCKRNSIGVWEKFIINGLNTNRSSGIEGTAKIQEGISIYPNPAPQGQFNITINSSKKVNSATIQILDISGKIVLSKDLGSLDSGVTPVSLDQIKNSITSGLYLVKINLDNKSSVKRISVK